MDARKGFVEGDNKSGFAARIVRMHYIHDEIVKRNKNLRESEISNSHNTFINHNFL